MRYVECEKKSRLILLAKICSNLTEHCVRIERGLKLKNRKLANTEEFGQFLNLMIHDFVERRRGAAPVYPSHELSLNSLRRHRALRKLESKGWVKRSSFSAYTKPWRGRWPVPRRLEQIGRPYTYFEFDSSNYSWNPYLLLSKLGFDTKRKLLELDAVLAQTGLIQRLIKAQLKFIIDISDNPSITSVISRVNQAFAQSYGTPLISDMERGMTYVNDMYVSKRLEDYVGKVAKAFHEVLPNGLTESSYRSWAREEAVLFIRLVAIFAGKARFELKGRSGVSTKEIIKWGSAEM